jgi:2,4-dienoyl-CoA reductase-like NADH-dependent reductase (Old Yellow Enzyme family)/thioredoxin reductase
MNNLMNVCRPIKIGNMVLKNRIVMAPMGTNLASCGGYAGSESKDWYVERARGGVGLITVEGTWVGPWQISSINNLRLEEGKFIARLRDLTDDVHAYGAKASIQLFHPGRQTLLEATGGVQPVAPSPIPCPVCSTIDPRAIPRELSLSEIQDLITAFGAAALRAKLAGFDAVELHFAHGYLVHQFMSPLSNKRTDRYGGDLMGRWRFGMEIVEKVKEMAGDDFPIIVRVSADDYIEGGQTIKDIKEMLPFFEEKGIDAISVSAALYPSIDRVIPPIYSPRGCNVPLAREIKQVVKVPVITVGRITSLAMAEETIKEGSADLVALGRPLIADPYLVKKTLEGNTEDVCSCIYCNFCLMERLFGFMTIRCSVNAAAGREGEYRLKKTAHPKKVLVVGGGPGGMEAARVAAQRGHGVILYDKNDKLGGQLLVSSIPPSKEEHMDFVNYLSTQVRKAGVKICLGKEASRETVKEVNPDVVIVATGGLPLIPEIPGIEKKIAVNAIDVLKEKVEVGARVLIAGGGLIGCEVATFLMKKGKNVTIVEMLKEVASDLEPSSKTVLTRELRGGNVNIMTQATVSEITDGGVVIIDETGKKKSIAGDTVVIALGLRPDRKVGEELRTAGVDYYEIGDCIQPRRIHHAVHEAAHIAREI